MKVLLLTSCLILSIAAEEVRLLDLDPNEAAQLIENKDQSLKYAPKVESNVPAVRVLGRDPHRVLEDVYIANQYHGQDGLGGYLYGYSVPDIAKTERKRPDGDLRGAYNYVNGDGQEIKVQYWDDGTGFHQVDNVPQILPQQIDDTPEVKAAKAEHARLWQEQAERNSHAPEDPNAKFGGSPYPQQNSNQGSSQYPRVPQYQSSGSQYSSSQSGLPGGQQFIASGAYQPQAPSSPQQGQYQPQGQYQGQQASQQGQYQPQGQYEGQPLSQQGQYQPQGQYQGQPASQQGQQYQPQGQSPSQKGQYQPQGQSSPQQGQYQPQGQYSSPQGQYQPQPSAQQSQYQPQPSSQSSNSVDYVGSYSEPGQSYAARPGGQPFARNNEEQKEETGPPRGFFYSFDYPVGIITQDQGKLLQKREDINNLYEKKKEALEQQLQQHGDYRVRRAVLVYA